jgi:hypothetical protein
MFVHDELPTEGTPMVLAFFEIFGHLNLSASPASHPERYSEANIIPCDVQHPQICALPIRAYSLSRAFGTEVAVSVQRSVRALVAKTD